MRIFVKLTKVKTIYMQTQFEELTDAQWSKVSYYLPTERSRKHNLRVVFNAILYLVRTGCQWRNLDSKYPKWQCVYYYFRTWTKLGIFAEINLDLIDQERIAQGRDVLPSVNMIDSQSVKIAPFTHEAKGIDGGKRINGRKRHIITDVNGFIMAVAVTSAKIHDAPGGCSIFKRYFHDFKQIKCFYADAAYGGTFKDLANANKIEVVIASKPESAKGFVPVKKRWVVERSFGWLNFFRRLSKDYEKKTKSSESMIFLAQIQIILNRNSA